MRFEERISDMNSLQRKTALIALVIGTAMAGAACEQRSPSTVSQKMDRPPETATTAAKDAMSKTANAVDDAAITAKVKTAIMAEPGLKSMQIDVDTKDAVVTLSGTVASAPLKDRAKEIASSVSGVRSVEDKLVTQSG